MIYTVWPWTRVRIPHALAFRLERRLAQSRELLGWTLRVFWDGYPDGPAYLSLASVRH